MAMDVRESANELGNRSASNVIDFAFVASGAPDDGGGHGGSEERMGEGQKNPSSQLLPVGTQQVPGRPRSRI